MARNFNRYPWGLLSFLDQKADGRNPLFLSETTQATLSLEPFLVANNVETLQGGWPGGIQSVLNIFPLTGYTLPAVPAGEAWYITRYSASAGSQWTPGTPPTYAFLDFSCGVILAGTAAAYNVTGERVSARYTAAELAAMDTAGTPYTPRTRAFSRAPFIAWSGNHLIPVGSLADSGVAGSFDAFVQVEFVRLVL